jgi:hypothetical protein
MKRDEASEIKRDKAKAVKNSGRGFRKGDAIIHSFLVDYKHYTKSFTLTRDAWVKLSKDSWRSTYKYPCMSLVIGENSDIKIAVVDKAVFDDLVSMRTDEQDYSDDFVYHHVKNKSTYSMSRTAWLRLERQAYDQGIKAPCVIVYLGEDSEVNVVLIPWGKFRRLIINTSYE